MSKLAKRLLTFFVGVPAVLLLVMLDVKHWLPLNIAIILGSVLAAYETFNIFSLKTKLFPLPIYLASSFILTCSSYIFAVKGIPVDRVLWIFLFLAIIILAIEAFTQKEFDKSIEKLSISIFLIFYAGYLFTFIQRISHLNNAKYFLSLFFIFVFMCDSAAWFFGLLFGKGTRGYIKASPNKSLVGFIGGIFGSTACGIVAKYIFPDIFTCSLIQMIVLGLLTSIAGIAGDLIESVLKRSSNYKDSGNVIPGRGGILDSADSIIIAAPVFYVIVFFIFG